MKKYKLLYSDKKLEDNICLLNMFKDSMKINVGWSEFDINNDIKVVEQLVKDGYEEIIIAGFETGWDRIVTTIKDKYPKLIIKVICNTQDSLLYYEYERENFFKLLELSKNNVIEEIAFLRKGQYEVYKELGYKCTFLYENYILDKKVKVNNKNNKKISVGFYPLNYVWDKNIFNQLCVGKMLDDSVITYNELDSRMTEFVETMNIEHKAIKINEVNDESLIKEIINNDLVISTSFTEYFHPIFFIAMELGVPCLSGNNVEFFDEKDELKKYVITSAEDNAIINSKIISEILENKEKIMDLYRKWKEKYNKIALKSIDDFIG